MLRDSPRVAGPVAVHCTRRVVRLCRVVSLRPRLRRGVISAALCLPWGRVEQVVHRLL